MQVAVNAANEAAPAAFGQKRRDACKSGAACGSEPLIRASVEHCRQRRERPRMLIDLGHQGCDPRLDRCVRCARMCGHYRTADRICERDIDTPRSGEMIERLSLVETAHLDRPLDRLTLAGNREPPIALARD